MSAFAPGKGGNMTNMTEDYLDTGACGIVPTGLPGGFFIYEAEGDEKILFQKKDIQNQVHGREDR